MSSAPHATAHSPPAQSLEQAQAAQVAALRTALDGTAKKRGGSAAAPDSAEEGSNDSSIKYIT